MSTQRAGHQGGHTTSLPKPDLGLGGGLELLTGKPVKTKVVKATFDPAAASDEAVMALIVLKVVPHLNRWALVHNEVTMASFATKAEAERTALAIAKHHPRRDAVELDFTRNDGEPSEIRVF
jgi:hypothetical protein